MESNLSHSLFDTHFIVAFFFGLSVLATLSAFADAGVLSLHTLDVCKDCDSPSPQSFR